MNDERFSKVRLFTGIPLSDIVREHVSGIVNGVSGKLPGVRWIAEEKWHVTLKFLGQCDQLMVGEICSMMRKASPFMPFRIEIGGLGAFPSTGSARVIWVGASDTDGGAAAVYRVFDREAVKLGFAHEKRRYTPHVTVGRARSKPASIPGEMVERFRDTVTLDVDQVLLLRSELKRNGAVYSVVDRIDA